MNTAADIIVEGGYPIQGTVQASGAKNSVLKLMAASILAPGTHHITNVPDISDVFLMAEVLKSMGIAVDFDRAGAALTIDTAHLTSLTAPAELVNQIRASIAVLGPLLTRYHEAHVAVPGGCQIGERKLDIHFAALEALGMEFFTDTEYIHASAPGGLTGAPVYLRFPSVGATENLMMAATLAKGTTIIDNAAREPEIADLANYLNSMGAQITGAGTSHIVVEGTSAMHPADHHTVGDRIESGTFLVAAALLGGPVTVQGISPDYFATALLKMQQLGLYVEKTESSVTVSRNLSEPLLATDIQTLPFPGFPTDLQAQFMVMASLAEGRSRIAENIFENRFQHAEDLVNMGADIVTEGHFAYVTGVSRLHGTTVHSSDLRAGAALVLAGLAAEGQTRVTNTEHIDRGYEGFVSKLQSLGASISRD
ncbi:MAG: UDP-N-acetylglucosamine 1-carboxyvinyltransferase [Coriobacteriia bacterium]|nr:UDP-N-acetylglucosamine 1-carboxyvinyltransferase [Coriobacteriia bacterium]MCL2137432.1 UDP-N-acetylglucosamine 1-carboxyvinyltransferase [Coriobacteriia bacterium]